MILPLRHKRKTLTARDAIGFADFIAGRHIPARIAIPEPRFASGEQYITKKHPRMGVFFVMAARSVQSSNFSCRSCWYKRADTFYQGKTHKKCPINKDEALGLLKKKAICHHQNHHCLHDPCGLMNW